MIAAALLGSACSVDRGETFAPTDAVLSVTAGTTLLPVNSPTTVTVSLTRLDGRPIDDGTVIGLTASDGELEQQKLRTSGGVATIGYRTGGQAGRARLTATSGTLVSETTISVMSAPLARLAVEARPAVVPSGGGEVELVAQAASPANAPVSGAPVTFRTSAGTLEPLQATTGSDGTARTRLRTTTTAVVVARVGTLDSEPVTVRVGPAVRLVLSTNPAQPIAGQPATIAVQVATSTGQAVSGRLVISFGTGQVADLGAVTGGASVSYVYPSAGGFNLTAEFGDEFGGLTRETIRVTVVAATAPGPAPGPSPGPSPTPTPSPGGGGDEIDPSQITWLHRDVSRWSITSRITSVSITSSEICVDHTGAGRFPTSRFGTIDVEGNVWIVAQFNGRWYAGTYDWLRPGQICKAVTGGELGRDQIRIPPMDASWPGPRSGEMVGFIVSARARDDVQAGAERTNIKLVRWP
jgi:hypothetical protein